MNQLLGLVGIAAIILIAVVFSSNRKAIRLRVVGAAFALQAVLAFLVLRTPWGRATIQAMSARTDWDSYLPQNAPEPAASGAQP